MMKKLFLSADIEGTCGIAHWDETSKGKEGYDQFARQMSLEVSAACEGALQSGADEVFIKDAHDSARNILPDLLPEQVRIFRGWGRDPYSMMSGLDESFDGAMFTGYHSAVGVSGNPLSHTMNLQNHNITINGVLGSELYMNVLTAAMFKVPVLLVAGDRMLCDFIKTINENIYTVPVSEGVGNGSISIHPSLAVRKIRQAAADATADARANKAKFIIPLPEHFTVEVTFVKHHSARRASFYKGAEQLDARTVRYECDEYMDVLRFFMFTL